MISMHPDQVAACYCIQFIEVLLHDCCSLLLGRVPVNNVTAKYHVIDIQLLLDIFQYRSRRACTAREMSLCYKNTTVPPVPTKSTHRRPS